MIILKKAKLRFVFKIEKLYFFSLYLRGIKMGLAFITKYFGGDEEKKKNSRVQN